MENSCNSIKTRFSSKFWNFFLRKWAKVQPDRFNFRSFKAKKPCFSSLANAFQGNTHNGVGNTNSSTRTEQRRSHFRRATAKSTLQGRLVGTEWLVRRRLSPPSLVVNGSRKSRVTVVLYALQLAIIQQGSQGPQTPPSVLPPANLL